MSIRALISDVLLWHHTITHRAHAGEAPALYECINRGEPVIGAVIHWSD